MTLKVQRRQAQRGAVHFAVSPVIESLEGRQFFDTTPSAPTVNPIDAFTVSVSWSDNQSHETGWEVAMYAGGSLVGVEAVGVNVTTAKITGLPPNSSITAKVRPTGTVSSEWSDVSAASQTPKASISGTFGIHHYTWYGLQIAEGVDVVRDDTSYLRTNDTFTLSLSDLPKHSTLSGNATVGYGYGDLWGSLSFRLGDEDFEMKNDWTGYKEHAWYAEGTPEVADTDDSVDLEVTGTGFAPDDGYGNGIWAAPIFNLFGFLPGVGISVSQPVVTGNQLPVVSESGDASQRTVQFTFTRLNNGTNTNDALTIPLDWLGTADAEDFGGSLPNSVTIQAGQQSNTVSIVLANDKALEATETIRVRAKEDDAPWAWDGSSPVVYLNSDDGPDIDVDSDNSDNDGKPDHSQAEDAIEAAPPSKGKSILSSQGVAPEKRKFVPLELDPETIKNIGPGMTFSFAMTGGMKLWTKASGQGLNPLSVAEGGDAIIAGAFYSLDEINGGKLYIEGTTAGLGSIICSAAGGSDEVWINALCGTDTCPVPVRADGSVMTTENDIAGELLTPSRVGDGTGGGYDFASGSELILCGNGVAIIEGTTVRVFDSLDSTEFSGKGALRQVNGELEETLPDGRKRRYPFPVLNQNGIGGPIATTAFNRGIRATSMQSAGDETGGTVFGPGGRVDQIWALRDNYREEANYTYDGGRVVLIELRYKRGTSAAVLIAKVAYDYYGANDANGRAGDLKSATIYDGYNHITDQKLYRYYTAGTNAGKLKYAFGAEAYARLVGANLNASSADSLVAAYADEEYEYDAVTGKVVSMIRSGDGCSACTGGFGETAYAFAVNTNPVSGYNAWKYKRSETLNDGTTKITFYNSASQPMLEVVQSGSETQRTYYRYDEKGRLIWTAEPSTVTGYDPNKSDLLNFSDRTNDGIVNPDYEFLADTNGLIHVTDYWEDGSVDPNAAPGYVRATGVKNGESNAIIQETRTEYVGHQVGGVVTYFVKKAVEYAGAGGTGARSTSYGYTWFGDGTSSTSDDSNQIASRTTARAVISSTQNGLNSTVEETEIFDSFGNLIWTRDGSGFINSYTYDDNGSLLGSVIDVNTAAITNEPSGWSTPTGGGSSLAESYEVDERGRTVKSVDANNNVTYTVYDDAAHEVRTYRGWNSVTRLPTGPIEVVRQDRLRGYVETLTFSFSGAGGLAVDGSGRPTGGENLASADVHIQSLARGILNSAGQVVYQDRYTNLTGVTYSASAQTLGTAGTNYLRTEVGYDWRGRQARVKAPDGTLTHKVFDNFDRVVEVWSGTNNTGWSQTDPSNGGGSGNNMVKVASFTYDASGNQLTSTSHADGSTSYTTANKYDFQNRVIDSRGPDKLATHFTYNNVGEQTQTESYVDLDTDFTIDAGESTGKLVTSYDEQGRVYQSSAYQGSRIADAVGSDNGSVAKVVLKGHGFINNQIVTIAGASQSAYNGTFTITVDNADQFHYTPGGSLVTTATGSRITVTADKRLTTNYWYDKRGNLIKTVSPSGLIQKTFYDGAGRVKRDTTSADPTEVASGTYAEASTLAADKVIEQNDYKLDKKGNTVIATNWQRDGSDTTTTGELNLSNASNHTSVVYFYDAAGRLTATMDYGRDGSESGGTAFVWNTTGYIDIQGGADGTPDVLQVTPGLSNSSSQTAYDWMYTGYQYDDAGNLWKVTDNAGRETRYAYDFAGRKTAMVENYVNGTATETETDTDRTTLYGYSDENGKDWGRLQTQTALNPLGSTKGVQQQVTTFAYGSDIDRSWVTATLYGDTASSVSTDSTGKGTVINGSDAVVTTYDRLGRKVTETDQRGVAHTYHYDSAGRLQYDTVGIGTLPAYVDGKVRTIKYVYDDQGRLSRTSSLGTHSSDLTQGTIRNEVGFTYDAWGNVIEDIQAHYGSVGSTGTKTTSFVYEDGSGTGTEAKYVRLAKTVYPSSTAYTTVYPAGDIGAALVRKSGIKDSSGNWLVQYGYLGIGQIAWTARPQASIYLSAGDAGTYENLDRYGRWAAIDWQGATTLDRRTYAYDRTGNRIATDVDGGDYNDESYAYDGLNRLIDWKIGRKTSGVVTTVSGAEAWTLDTLGNWRSHGVIEWGSGASTYRTDTREVNKANEITTYTGTRGVYNLYAPTYDAAGNIIHTGKTGNETAPIAFELYDGWGRQVISDQNNGGSITDLGDTRTNYDGLGRMIGQFVDGVQDSTNNVGTTEEYYYNEAGQIIEVYNGSTSGGTTTIDPDARERTVWDDSYVNAAAMQELDNNTDGTTDQRLYALWDANYNVIALAADHGYTVERYLWTPYGGEPAALNGQSNYAGTSTDEGYDYTYDFSGTDYSNFRLGFQGMRWDGRAGEYRTMTRAYLPSLGTFASRDPLGAKYPDGMNNYHSFSDNPIQYTDPLGLDAKVDEVAKNGKATCGEWAFSSGIDPMPSWISSAIELGLVSQEDVEKGRYLNPDLAIGGEHPIYVAAKLKSIGVTRKNKDGYYIPQPGKESGIKPLGSSEAAIDKPCPPGHYKVILYLYSNPIAGAQGIDPAKGDLMANDWHWATQHADGSYSDKNNSRKACACSPRPIPVNPFMKVVGVFCVKGEPRIAPEKLP